MQDATPITRKKVDLFTTDVEEYFSKYPRNEITYNTLILGLAERSLLSEARLALDDMKVRLIKLDTTHISFSWFLSSFLCRNMALAPLLIITPVS